MREVGLPDTPEFDEGSKNSTFPRPRPRPCMNSPLESITKASDVGPALLGKLAELVPPAVIAAKIHEMLDAELKNARGEFYPDWRAREAGIKLYLSYQLGMPVQRQIVVNEQRENKEQTLERLLASPASRRALQMALEPTLE